MAKSNWGITSGFKGKLGNVVGYNWKGTNLLRKLQDGENPRTEAQQLHRAKFALVGKAGSALYDAAFEGFRHEASTRKSTRYSEFVRENLHAVIGNSVEVLQLDYSRISLSKGRVLPATFGTPTVSGNTITVSVSSSSYESRRVSQRDRVYLCAFCPEEDFAVCKCAGERADESVDITIPEEFAGKAVHLYAFLIGAASGNEGQASPTVYLGELNAETNQDGQSNQGNQGGATTGGTEGGGSDTGGNEGGGTGTDGNGNGGSSQGEE